MGRGWREFFYFSKADRRVLLLLSGALLGFVLSALFFWKFGAQEAINPGTGGVEAKYAAFVDSLQADTPQVHSSSVSFRQPEERVVETFFFDPNTADSTMLLRLGLSPWQVRNIYKYRARGGRYHRPTVCVLISVLPMSSS